MAERRTARGRNSLSLASIEGFKHVLEGEAGFRYRARDGLNIAVSGPAGSGKSLLALQTAVGSAVRQGRNVIYLSKDAPPETIVHHAWRDFLLFGEADEKEAEARGYRLPPRRVKWEETHGAPDVKEDPAGYAEWLRRSPSSDPSDPRPNIRCFCTCHLPLSQADGHSSKQRPAGLLFVFLDRLLEALCHARIEGKDLGPYLPYLQDCLWSTEPVLAVGGLGVATSLSPSYSENVWKGPLLGSLARVREDLAPFFAWLAQGAARGEGATQYWAGNLLVVLDSLPVKLLEDCLKAQSERPDTPQGGERFSRPAAVYVAESPDLPESLVSSFPPDVQIKLGFRDDPHATRTRTIQILKARFQAARTEEFPFVIVDKNECRVGRSEVLQIADGNVAVGGAKHELTWFERREPGITILPSVADAATCRGCSPDRVPMPVRFGDSELDSLTMEGNLAGGCTLLATENRCHSTMLGLHFLLGEMARCVAARDKAEPVQMPPQKIPGVDIPRSVLYLAVDQDLRGVLHDIWRYAALRSVIWNKGEPGNPGEFWNHLKQVMEKLKSGQKCGLQWLYKIPLRHRECHGKPQLGLGPYLYVFTPDLVWCTQEEVLERIARVLDYDKHAGCPQPDPTKGRKPPKEPGYCLAVDRVLFNRVSRLESRWPLMRDPTVFVSSLAQMCRVRQIELMIIDDTARQPATSGNITSNWISAAQNIIRLKRVPFHGTEAVALELIRAHGRSPRVTRPMELHSELITRPEEEERKAHEWQLRVKDSFRGYTGLFTGRPKRCRITVDLPYDRKDTPLYRDMMNTKANLVALMEGIKVNVNGPEERPGVNSALRNLTEVSHDTCHVAAVDEIWIHSIIGDESEDPSVPSHGPGLARLPIQDLRKALFEQADEPPKPSPRGSFQEIKNHYVTESMTIACKKAKRPEGFYAVPFRHNWGVLAVSQPRRLAMQGLVESIRKAIAGAPGLEALDDLSRPMRPVDFSEWGGESFVGLSCVLRDREPSVDEITDKQLRSLCCALRELIWEDGALPEDVTWQTLVDFNLRVWDPIRKSPGYEKLHRDMAAQAQAAASLAKGSLDLRDFRQWFGRGTEVNFFDFDRGTPESIVCFLFELLLAHCDWDDLFLDVGEQGTTKETYGTGSLLFLRTIPTPGQLPAMTNALTVMYRLLSPRQRREIAIGPVIRHRLRDADDSDARKRGRRPPLDSPPSTYALISREWISTVPDLGAHRDIRERIVLRHLPPAAEGEIVAKRRLRRVISEPKEPSPADEEELLAECLGKGPTVSGTWYLGALSGGNVDVARDVIHELVSEYHERDRMITGGAAPVTKRFYRPFPASEEGSQARVPYSAPYARLISLVYRERGDETNSKHIPTFPFSRTRLREYTSTALELAKLVRQVMEIPDPADPGLAANEAFRKVVSDLIWQTLQSIRHQIYIGRGREDELIEREGLCPAVGNAPRTA
ncbi:MAG TPA: hypothetical protein VNE39_19030 [Planctomycetota bacterium]|nr:hypothetical protein [Planctomycetota bacterium]